MHIARVSISNICISRFNIGMSLIQSTIMGMWGRQTHTGIHNTVLAFIPNVGWVPGNMVHHNWLCANYSYTASKSNHLSVLPVLAVSESFQ